MINHLSIEVVTGGFILQYFNKDALDNQYKAPIREIFASRRKLVARINELLGLEGTS